jgi:hypothetical protein
MFYEISLIGATLNAEKVVNTWAFRETPGVGETNSPAKCQTIALAFLTLWQVTIQAATIAEVQFTQLNVVGYEGNGQKSPFPTVEVPITPFIGTLDSVRDGNFIAATVSKRLGVGTLMNVGGRIPIRGYWAVGPIHSSAVANTGALITADPQWTGLQAWAGRANDPIILAGPENVDAVVVSHTQTNILLPGGVEVSPDVTGWAPVDNGILRAYVTRRVSRNNQR